MMMDRLIPKSFLVEALQSSYNSSRSQTDSRIPISKNMGLCVYVNILTGTGVMVLLGKDLETFHDASSICHADDGVVFEDFQDFDDTSLQGWTPFYCRFYRGCSDGSIPGQYPCCPQSQQFVVSSNYGHSFLFERNGDCSSRRSKKPNGSVSPSKLSVHLRTLSIAAPYGINSATAHGGLFELLVPSGGIRVDVRVKNNDSSCSRCFSSSGLCSVLPINAPKDLRISTTVLFASKANCMLVKNDIATVDICQRFAARMLLFSSLRKVLPIQLSDWTDGQTLVWLVAEVTTFSTLDRSRLTSLISVKHSDRCRQNRSQDRHVKDINIPVVVVDFLLLTALTATIGLLISCAIQGINDYPTKRDAEEKSQRHLAATHSANI
uniref:Uncharacterized protein n=1 Tax=Glossina brevipalpis TaxID=37001 RepID=A0A1A9WRJ7_9MUSC